MKKLSAVCFSIILAAMLVGVGMGQKTAPPDHHMVGKIDPKVGGGSAYRSTGPVCVITKVTMGDDGLIVLETSVYDNPGDAGCSAKGVLK